MDVISEWPLSQPGCFFLILVYPDRRIEEWTYRMTVERPDRQVMDISNFSLWKNAQNVFVDKKLKYLKFHIVIKIFNFKVS